MATGWLELPILLRKWLASQIAPEEIQTRKSERDVASHFNSEFFEERVRPGHSILLGKFQIGNEIIQVTHSQWEGDSYLMSLQQRKEILRMTVLERIKKAPTVGSA
ncbi:MAG: hypothetical protein HYT76_09890 [Deltaproteobacteria bacterium]|nr:hypothetical protein [Deltaproteobacteria bacterium]